MILMSKSILTRTFGNCLTKDCPEFSKHVEVEDISFSYYSSSVNDFLDNKYVFSSENPHYISFSIDSMACFTESIPEVYGQKVNQ